MKKKTTGTKKEVKRILTLSKYHYGMHHVQDDGPGQPSFAESLSPLHWMIAELHEKGIPLGSKIEVTMKVKR